MPSKEAFHQLVETFKRSKSFQTMDPVEQAGIKKKYSESTDEQIGNAIKIMESEEKISAALDREEQFVQEKKTEVAKNLRSSLHTIKMRELKEAQEKEQEESNISAQKILREIRSEPKNKPKRKWWKRPALIVFAFFMVAGVIALIYFVR